MGGLPQRLFEGQLDPAVDDLGRQRRSARLTALIAQQAGHALAGETLSPTPDTWPRDAGAAPALDVPWLLAATRAILALPDVLLRAVPVGHNCPQSSAVGGANLELGPFDHAAP